MPETCPPNGSDYYRLQMDAAERRQSAVPEDPLPTDAEVVRLRTLLAAAERVLQAHHVAGTRYKGQVCPQCLVEHETLQAIWREVHG